MKSKLQNRDLRIKPTRVKMKCKYFKLGRSVFIKYIVSYGLCVSIYVYVINKTCIYNQHRMDAE